MGDAAGHQVQAFALLDFPRRLLCPFLLDDVGEQRERPGIAALCIKERIDRDQHIERRSVLLPQLQFVPVVLSFAPLIQLGPDQLTLAFHHDVRRIHVLQFFLAVAQHLSQFPVAVAEAIAQADNGQTFAQLLR